MVSSVVHDQAKFLDMVDSMPLVSIDLLLEDESGRFLVGRRINKPAQGYLFVPGGRILKGESLDSALQRIVRKELGPHVSITAWQPRGVFQHFYDDNFAGAPGISTHYVVMPYYSRATSGSRLECDDQHEQFLWLSAADLLARSDVHDYTKAYFLGDRALGAA